MKIVAMRFVERKDETGNTAKRILQYQLATETTKWDADTGNTYVITSYEWLDVPFVKDEEKQTEPKAKIRPF